MDPLGLALHGGLDAALHCQNGVIRRDQALAAGVATSTLESLVSRGHWTRIFPRVYSVDADLDDPRVVIRAGWLWAGDDAAVAGSAAAWWLGLTDRAPENIRLLVPSRRRMSGQPGVQIVRCHIRPSDLALVDRVVVTSAARTCLDLVRLSETDNLEKALRTRALTQAQLQVSLDLGTRMRGQRKARAARADVVDNPWSEPERAMHLLLRRAGITGWKGNVPITSNGGVRYPDITFDELKLIIEIDGRAHHGSAEAFDADHRRQDHLVTAGWTVLRFTPRQLADDPEWVIATVRATIARLRSQLID